MNKIIATGSLLAMTAMGMACGGTATNVNVATNKPANNTAIVVPANTATPMAPPSNMGSTTGNSMSNGNSAMKPANSSMGNSNMKSNMTSNKPANK